MRISMALRGATDDTPAYDVYIIDTQGAVGHLRDAAVNAADVLITPWCATSFQHASSLQAPCNCSNAMNRWSMGYKVPAMKAVINCFQCRELCHIAGASAASVADGW